MDREQAAPKIFASEAHTTARRVRAFTLPKQRGPESVRGFTLVELLVTMGVLVLLVFLASQLLNTAATVTRLGHKQMDADAQTRQLLDRMEVDVAQMVKRADVDYYVKSSWFATAAPSPAPGCIAYCSNLYNPAIVGSGVRTVVQRGNDTIAFYGYVPGYYPATGSQSPLSLVAYRVYNPSPAPAPCADCNKLERMGKGLVWNAVSNTDVPVVFLPIPIASPVPTPELPQPTVSPNPAPAWPEIANRNASWSDLVPPQSEIIGPQVFRFEYYYLLKGQTDPINTSNVYDPRFTDMPWDPRICSCPNPTPTSTPLPIATPTPIPTPIGTPVPTPTPPVRCCHAAPEGMQDVAAIVVVIAVIDPTSRALVTDAQLARLNGADGQAAGPVLIDWGDPSCGANCTQAKWQTTPGLLLAQWTAALDANISPNGIGLPPPARAGIRVYERVLYLPPPTLLAP
jgi:prepilin-type N-terminal cleavage/methylation domain-containing protein